MLKDLFYKSFFTIKCTSKNKVMATILVDTCAIRYSFINKEFAKTVCQVLKIKPKRLIKPK